MSSLPWFSIFHAADVAGKSELARYRLEEFLSGLAECLGKNDDDFVKNNDKARFITPDRTEWKLIKRPLDQVIKGKVVHGSQVTLSKVVRAKNKSKK